MTNDEMREHAKGLVKAPLDLIEKILIKHHKAIIEQLGEEVAKCKVVAPTDQQVAEWARRHDFIGSRTDLRAAFEDAQTATRS